MPRDRRTKPRRSPDNTVVREARRHRNRRQGGDRRGSRRVAVDLWVEQERGPEVCFRHVGDLSVGGIRLDQGFSYPVGTRLRLRFTLPGDTTVIEAAAEVVAATAEGDRAQTRLHFSDLSAGDRGRISAFIDAVTEPGV